MNNKIALVWTQFTAYHGDRCAAVTNRLKGKYEVTCIEIASTSDSYGDFTSHKDSDKYHKLTLFPGQNIDTINAFRRFWRSITSLYKYKRIFIGVPYSYIDFLILSWLLMLLGREVTLMIDSKFDDRSRTSFFEFCKRLGLSCFHSAIFASKRTMDYLQFLGFKDRSLVPGYDTVSIDRIRRDAANSSVPNIQFQSRPFIYIGRFVEKKNLDFLIDSYRKYVSLEGRAARKLVIVGSGPLKTELRRHVATLALESHIEFVGFREGPDLAGLLRYSLGLILVSSSEQWGLVINEAVALGIPAIVSESPGARDILCRSLITGWVIEEGSACALVKAMQELGQNEESWMAMSEAVSKRAWFADTDRFADAVEYLLDDKAEPAASNVAEYLRELMHPHS